MKMVNLYIDQLMCMYYSVSSYSIKIIQFHSNQKVEHSMKIFFVRKSTCIVLLQQGTSKWKINYILLKYNPLYFEAKTIRICAKRAFYEFCRV